METVELCDGKYLFGLDRNGILTCDRYGEPWLEFTGDKAVYALFDEVLRLRHDLQRSLASHSADSSPREESKHGSK